MLSVAQHANLHQKAGRFWGQREPWFVENIPNRSVVLDLGAGSMHLRTALAEAGRRITYIPVDATHRGDPAMRLCNLNNHEYPLSITPLPRVLVVQGVLEYLYDKLLFLRTLRCAYMPRATLLLSYAVGHATGKYQNKGWAAPLTAGQLAEIFQVLQVNVTHQQRNCFPEQTCMRIVAARGPAPAAICAGFSRARKELTVTPKELNARTPENAHGNATHRPPRDQKRGTGGTGLGSQPRLGHGLGPNMV